MHKCLNYCNVTSTLIIPVPENKESSALPTMVPALEFWSRMAKEKEGRAVPPEFMSTHPSDATRIANLQKRMPEALAYYKPDDS